MGVVQQLDVQFCRALMWDERGLIEHSLRKRQTKQIIGKIELRHYLEMRSHRSEGSEVANDYARQLRHAVRKSKTEKLTLHRDLRQKLMTQLSQRHPRPFTSLSKLPLQLPVPKKQRNNLKRQQGLHQENQQKNRSTNEQQVSKVVVEIESSNSSEEQQLQNAQSNMQLSMNPARLHLDHVSHTNFQQNHQKKHFLPMLELYIQELSALKTMSPNEKRVRNLIATMMILAINRRQNKRLFDALDVLLQTEIYFPKEKKEMIHLKSVWLSLIGKIYQEISKTLKVDSGSRWRKATRANSMRSTQHAKRKNTIFIRSLASRKSFLDKFSQSLRKSKLIFESTYLLEIKNDLNAMMIEEGRRMVSRVSQEVMIFYPQPKDLFPESQNILNYAIVMINKDKEANLFPLNYPQGLAGFISKQEYISKIVKINSYLVPAARCTNLQSALFLNFQLILSIFVILLGTSIILLSSVQRVASILLIIFAVIVFWLAGWRIHRKGKSGDLNQIGQASQLLQKCCEQWEQEYKTLEIKIILDSICDVLIISFPVDSGEQQSEELSSFAYERQQSRHPSRKQQSRKCSIRIPTQHFENPITQVSQDSSDDNELNQQFWKEIEGKNEDNIELSFKKQFGGIQEQSQDEVIKYSPYRFEDPQIQVEAMETQYIGDFQ